MAIIEKLSIALTPEMAGLVRGAVESGEYATSSEVVREALREWKKRRALQQGDIEELQRLWAEGLARGPRLVRQELAGEGGLARAVGAGDDDDALAHPHGVAISNLARSITAPTAVRKVIPTIPEISKP
jgi:antitoxin ParD1/3/4